MGPRSVTGLIAVGPVFVHRLTERLGCPQLDPCALNREQVNGTVRAMGYQTALIGYLDIQPPLNEREIRVINLISGSAPTVSEPRTQLAADCEEMARLVGGSGPHGWSNWAVCSQGCCLSYDGGDKANHMIPWLLHLMSTLLVPDAVAQGWEGFEGLTFDHVLNGMVVGSRLDNGELYSITVRDNDVVTEMLWPGSPWWSSYPRLEHLAQIDKRRLWATDNSKPPPSFVPEW